LSRMEAKYWPYSINFVEHFEAMERAGRQLLQQIGAWEAYEASRWGSTTASTDGTTPASLAIFQKYQYLKALILC
jgi:hypothetical protein